MTRRSGERSANPPLGARPALPRLTTYGASEFHAEILLGLRAAAAPRDAGAHARCDPADAGARLAGHRSILPPPLDTLTASELADQVEQIRLTPETMSLEEISKLWGAIQSHYRPTAAYQASVVLIESRRLGPSRAAGRQRQAATSTSSRSASRSIEQVVNAAGDLAPDRRGRHARDPRTRAASASSTLVNLDGIEIAPAADRPDARADRRCPLDLTPAGGPPSPASRASRSSTGSRWATRRPTIAASSRTSPPSCSGRRSRTDRSSAPATSSGSSRSTEIVDGVTDPAARRASLRLDFDPRVGRDQRVSLLLNELNVAPGRASREPTRSGRRPATACRTASDDTATVEIPFARVVAGTYLVRVQVNGAESLLAQDGTGAFADAAGGVRMSAAADRVRRESASRGRDARARAATPGRAPRSRSEDRCAGDAHAAETGPRPTTIRYALASPGRGCSASPPSSATSSCCVPAWSSTRRFGDAGGVGQATGARVPRRSGSRSRRSRRRTGAR